MTINEAVKYIEDQKEIFGGTHREFLDNVLEWLEELEFVRQWKSGVIEDFCKYDASNIDEIAHNARNKAVNDFAKTLKQEILEEICNISESQRNYEVGSDMSITCSHIMGTLRDVYHRIIEKVIEKYE